MQAIKHKIKFLDVILTVLGIYCIASLGFIAYNYEELNQQPSEEPKEVYNITLVNVYDNKSCK